MDAIEKRARDLLAAEVDRDAAAMPGVEEVAASIREGGHGDVLFVPTALRAIIAALTPHERSDQNLLELAATFETCIPFLPPAGRRNIGKAVAQLRHVAMGYVDVGESQLRALAQQFLQQHGAAPQPRNVTPMETSR